MNLHVQVHVVWEEKVHMVLSQTIDVSVLNGYVADLTDFTSVMVHK